MNTKLLVSVLGLAVVVGGGVYLIKKGHDLREASQLAHTQDLGMYPYVCDNGSAFNLSPLEGMKQVQVSADAQGMWNGTATLEQTETHYVGNASDGQQIALMGDGETVHLQVGSTQTDCNPKPSDTMASFNWGDAAVPGDNLALGENKDASGNWYLIAYNGMALYTYAKDTKGASNCSSACAAAWPPYVVTSSNLVAEAPLDSAKIGTTTRADGSVQLTWGGMPLYFYAGDKVSGDVKGAAIANWSLAKP